MLIRSRNARTLPLAIALVCSAKLQAQTANTLFDMDLSSLMQMNVESVARRSQNLADTAASVYVLSAEDIASSSAQSVPDLLRSVPGLDVAQIDGNKWAISARGFNGRLVSKLLVIVDGRNVISPTYGNTFWETKDLVLSQIERIEVIRGAGATIWGANAVNGVISITTKSAAATTGATASVTTISDGSNIASVTLGTQIGEQGAVRVYGKFREAAENESTMGIPAFDGWQSRSLGFRYDQGEGTQNEFTLQGDLFDQSLDQLLLRGYPIDGSVFDPLDHVEQSGQNLMGRWRHTYADNSSVSTQIFIDVQDRKEITLDERTVTYDLDLNWQNSDSGAHHLTVGAGVRRTEHTVTTTPYFFAVPQTLNLDRYSLGVRDDFQVSDKTIVGLSLKVENNVYTGTEYMPNISLNHSLDEHNNVWASLTRAVRTPVRGERDGTYNLAILPAGTIAVLPVPVEIQLGPTEQFQAEVLKGLEFGWRHHYSNSLLFDVVGYYNEYSQLRGLEAGNPLCLPDPACFPVLQQVRIPMQVSNLAAANTFGAEFLIRWSASPGLQLEASFNLGRTEYDAGSVNASSLPLFTGNISGGNEDLLYKFNFMADWKITEHSQLNSELRIVSDPGIRSIDSYAVVDLQYQYTVNELVSFKIAGRNLGSSKHAEFLEDVLSTANIYVEPTVQLQVDLSW